MDRIVEIQVARLAKLLATRNVKIKLDAKAEHWLAQTGYDPVYGARPLKRVIQRYLQDPLAQLVLEGKVEDGATVKVSGGKRGLVIDGTEFAPELEGLSILGGGEPQAPSHVVH
jgi:ATP-dependent Clp protease ATP-binding subunit ClpB